MDIEIKKKNIKATIEKFINNGNLKDALEVILEYEKIDKDDIELISMKSVIHIIEENYVYAKNIIKYGLELDKENFDLNYNIAYIYEIEGKFNEALKYYRISECLCSDLLLKDKVTEIISKIEKNHKDIIKKSRKKIAFFVKPGMDSFLGGIIEQLCEEYETKKVIVSDLNQIDSEMNEADICWFEWCDDLVIYGSKLQIAKEKNLICRLHSYEAFTDYINYVEWDNVDKIIFVSNYIKDNVMSKININKDKASVIPNWLDIEQWEFSNRTSGFNIAYVGYINYKKGPMLLLHTFKAIYDKDSRYKLFIAGQFQDERDILYFEQMIKEFGIENNVVFDGWQSNLNEWLEDKNYVLCTSILESQNMSIMQAMAKGIKPIIHNFVGAKTIYPEKYVWNTINDAVKMILDDSYKSEEYLNFIKEKYLDKNQHLLLINSIVSLNSVKKAIKEYPLVTVGIINYNYSEYLMEAVNSVLNQSYKNIEILIVDDYSNDGSIEIIEELEKKYKNVKGIFHSKNSGSAVKAFQEIIRESNGKYFMFLSADDLLAENDVILKYVNEFLLDNHLDFVYGNIKIYDDNKNDVWKYKEYSDDEIIYEVFNRKGSGIIPITTGLFSSEFYRRNNLNWVDEENNRVAGDTLNTLINLKYKWKRKYIDTNTICYRHHNNNMTYDLKNRIKSIISVMEYIINNFDHKKYLQFYKYINTDTEITMDEKNYFIGLNYYDTFVMYLNNSGMPWKHDLDLDDEQIREFLQPLIIMIEKYLKKSIEISKKYIENVTIILDEIKKYKININKNSQEYNLQHQIVLESHELRKQLLEKYRDKYINSNLKFLIYSPTNGYWKYTFLSWKSVLNYMGVDTKIIYEVNEQYNYEEYNTFITIGEACYINNSYRNQSIIKIKNKIGIASKQNNNEELDLLNIELCKNFKFNFLIASSINEANEKNLFNWIRNEINVVSIQFGFNPLINYPELTNKIYDYFLVGTNSYLKYNETEKYLVPIIQNNNNGIIRGTGWGNEIKELNPRNSNFFYNRAKINLNYHLDIQKKIKNEVNERTFIISACGGFQLIDNPKLISDLYTDNDLAIATDQYDYLEKFKYYLNKPKERFEKAYNSLITTYKNDYSLFNRIEKIIELII